MKIKIKQWIKNHKKDIAIGITAAGGTALLFLIKEKKLKSLVKGGLRLTLDLLDGYDEDYPSYRGEPAQLHTILNLRKPNLTVGDLGKVGDLLKEKIPNITNDMKIDYLNTNYNLRKIK